MIRGRGRLAGLRHGDLRPALHRVVRERLAGGAVAGAFMRSILYGISPLDPFVFSTMIVSLLLTAIAACALPALRAVRIEPMQALRAE